VPGLQWAEFALAPGFKLGLHADPEGHEEGARSPGGASGFYFTVPDVDAAVAKLRERGVKIADEPEDKPYGRDAAFLDPDGNLIAIVAPAPEG
jgi:predicted enzyme related to lactoylglutathione lyase